MTFFDELGLKAAEQLEQSVGAYVALASYKRLLGATPEIRGPAIFGALRCAVDLGDEREVRELSQSWSREHHTMLARDTSIGTLPSTPAHLVLRLLAGGRRDLAAELANAEATRKPSAHALYVLARAREEASGPDPELWSRTVALAAKEGQSIILVRAVARWLELVSGSSRHGVTREQMVERAQSVDLEEATPVERLVVLRARLMSPSRFARASALSGLEELARSAPSPVRAHAILACAHAVDVVEGRLDPIEIDRVRATLKHSANPVERDSALSRLEAVTALANVSKSNVGPEELGKAIDRVVQSAPEAAAQVHRARALFSGGSGVGGALPSEPAHRPSSAALRLVAFGLDAYAALSRGEDKQAEAALTRASEALSPTCTVPSVLWLSARAGLRSKNNVTRRAAVSFVGEALSRSVSPPVFGFVELAIDLEQAGFPGPQELALKEAARLKEPRALLMLADAERRIAYAALARGDRKRALEALRQAKDLFARISSR